MIKKDRGDVPYEQRRQRDCAGVNSESFAACGRVVDGPLRRIPNSNVALRHRLGPTDLGRGSLDETRFSCQ